MPDVPASNSRAHTGQHDPARVFRSESYSGAPPISRRNYWIFKFSIIAIAHTPELRDVFRSERLRDLLHEYGSLHINGRGTVEGCTKRHVGRNVMTLPVPVVIVLGANAASPLDPFRFLLNTLSGWMNQSHSSRQSNA